MGGAPVSTFIILRKGLGREEPSILGGCRDEIPWEACPRPARRRGAREEAAKKSCMPWSTDYRPYSARVAMGTVESTVAIALSTPTGSPNRSYTGSPEEAAISNRPGAHGGSRVLVYSHARSLLRRSSRVDSAAGERQRPGGFDLTPAAGHKLSWRVMQEELRLGF